MRIEAALRARHPRIVTIRMTDSVLLAARRLRAENVHLLVVKDTCATEGDAVLGVITERHILQAIVDHGIAAMKMPVTALMSRHVICCAPHDTVEHALALMHANDVRHLPVLQDGALIAVVSLRDLLALSKTAEPEQLAAA